MTPGSLSVRNAIPVMRAQGGGVTMNVGSGITRTLIPGLAPSSSTRHVLNDLSLIAHAELARDGVVVSLVHPGLTATDFRHSSVGTTPGPDVKPAQSDPAGYVGGLIVQAVQTGQAEVHAGGVRGCTTTG